MSNEQTELALVVEEAERLGRLPISTGPAEWNGNTTMVVVAYVNVFGIVKAIPVESINKLLAWNRRENGKPNKNQNRQ